MFHRRRRSIRKVALGALLLLIGGHATAAEYMIDPLRTEVSFEVSSLGTVQRGQFNSASGTVALEAGAGVQQVDIAIDARSISASNEAVRKLMSGPALLNAESYPAILYRSQRVVFIEGAPVRIEGELTLRGVTHPVPLAVTRYDCTNEGASAQRCAMVASASFSRSAFGMTRFRMLASDEVKLAVHAEAVR